MTTYHSTSKNTDVEIKDMPTPHLRAAFYKLLLELVRNRTLDRPNGVDVLMALHDECSERWDREFESFKLFVMGCESSPPVPGQDRFMVSAYAVANAKAALKGPSRG